MQRWRVALGSLLIRAGARLTGASSNSEAADNQSAPDPDSRHEAEADKAVSQVAGPADEVVADVDPAAPVAAEGRDDPHQQVRQLIKKSLETPTPQEFVEFLAFTHQFRRLAVWNARMAYIQRPGARVIGSEYEWRQVGRSVLADAVPIIILWPFSPIRFVYELADTGPPIDREQYGDPFAVDGVFKPGSLTSLISALKKQKTFKVDVEARRQGFSYAGSAAAQGALPLGDDVAEALDAGATIGGFADTNVLPTELAKIVKGVPTFRVTVNDRLTPTEQFVTIAHELGHIFCGHLGECKSKSGNDEESGWPDRRHLNKPEREVEAEAVAFLVAARAGVTTRSAEYLQDYAKHAQMSEIDLDVVVRAAARIERLAKIHYGTMAFKAPS